MAPFNMRCATCGEYIYKGKKFNARKEDVENEDYLGIRIYRFYIKVSKSNHYAIMMEYFYTVNIIIKICKITPLIFPPITLI